MDEDHGSDEVRAVQRQLQADLFQNEDVVWVKPIKVCAPLMLDCDRLEVRSAIK